MSRVWFLTIDKNLNDIFVFKLALKRLSFESWAVTEIDTHAGKNQNEYSRFAGEHIATIHHQPELNSCFTTSCRLTYWILFNIIQWLQHCFHTKCNQPAFVFQLVPDICVLFSWVEELNRKMNACVTRENFT